MNDRKGGFYFERKMYQSESFLSLNKNSMKLLIALLDGRIRNPACIYAKKQDKNFIEPFYININNIEMPYETLKKKYGMNQQAIVAAIDQLLSHGFIKITRRGGLGEHHTSLYGLVEDYLSWSKNIVFRKREPRKKIGYQKIPFCKKDTINKEKQP